MNDFFEAVVEIEVSAMLAHAYKKAIEDENSRYWVKNTIADKDGTILSNELKPIWNGNHVTVKINRSTSKGNVVLSIAIVSHTKDNVESTAQWYVRQGEGQYVYKNY